FGSLSQLICTILYLFIIIYFMVIEIKLLFKLRLKYFRQFWSVIQIGIISCSWASAAVYIWRISEASHISKLFEETNGYVYINL
ncbi:unnamed protein product, partial [Adineta steineri]